MGFTNEMWGTITLRQIIEDQQTYTRLVNLFNDYTPLTEGVRASAYNGPVIDELETVALPATSAQDPTKSVIRIAFDKEFGSYFKVKDIELAQTNVDMIENYTRNAALSIASRWDLEITKELLTAKPATQLSSAKLTLAEIKAARKSFNTSKVPAKGRVLIIGPDLEESLYDISEFISYDKIGSTEALSEGRIGRVLGFEVVLFNDMPKAGTGTDKDQCIFAGKSALGFARQKVIDAASNFDASIPATMMNIYTVFGVKVQKSNFYLTYRQKD